MTATAQGTCYFAITLESGEVNLNHKVGINDTETTQSGELNHNQSLGIYDTETKESGQKNP